jgi:hypothetical protein
MKSDADRGGENLLFYLIFYFILQVQAQVLILSTPGQVPHSHLGHQRARTLTARSALKTAKDSSLLMLKGQGNYQIIIKIFATFPFQSYFY